MSFPEWGYSYNALYVPLSEGWHCALMPAREVLEVDRGWRLSFNERKQKKKEQREQIEQDRKDFDRLFKLRADRRSVCACSEFRKYVAFINRHLRVSSWDLLDGEGITRALRAAVRDGHITPVIDRNWHGGQRVFKHYAPQSWPSTGSCAQATSEVLTWREFAALREANGETGFGSHLVDSDSSALGNATSRMSGAVGEVGAGGVNWASVVNAAGGAVAGFVLGSPDLGDDRGDSILRSFGNSDDSGSLFGDAQAFDYQPDNLSGEILDVAGASRGDMYACDIISPECKGSVLREFPSQYLDSTYDDIQCDARDGIKDARKALKLLNDNRFKK